MKVAIYYAVFVFGYVTLALTTSMYFMTWGAKRNMFEKAYVFMIGRPFDPGKSLWFLLVNAVFWATAFYLIAHGIRKLKGKL